MKTAKLWLIIIWIALTTSLYAQPDLPPDDDTEYDELDVPITGSDIFFMVALGIGGVLIYKRQIVSKELLKTEEGNTKL